MKKGLNRTLSVISKIGEIASWIAVVAGLVCFAASFDKTFVGEIVADDGGFLTGIGFNVNALTQAGDINFFAVTMYFVGVTLAFVLAALIFRNLDIILYIISGRHKTIQNTSPFQDEVVKRVKKIGILSIATPVWGFIVTTIIYVVSIINGNPVDVNVAIEGIIVGLVCLCLTQIFAYGASLEKEVDGLL